MRRLSLILALLALCGALGTATAQASPWTLTNLNLGDGETIFGMHCEASGFCVGVGQEGVVIQSTAPTAGAGAWAIGHLTPAENLATNLRGISCPTATLCVAVDFSGGVWTTNNPGLGAASWTPTKIPKAKSLFGVSCVSETQCMLVGSAGLVVTSSNPTGGPTAWTRTTLPGGPPLRAVSCVGTLCVASAFSGEIWTTTNPAGGASAWTSAGSPGGETPVLGLTCWNEALCVAGNEGNAAVSTAPTAGTVAWPFGPLQRRFQIVGASCPTSTLCVLSSNNGEVSASTNPNGGWGTFVTEHLIKGVTNALFGLSCPTETLCVAAGKFGQLLTTTQPAATGLPEPPPPPPPPTTLLMHAPPAKIRLGVHAPAPTVAFRFKGHGIGPFWFRCKLDSKPGAICAAPRKYRVGVGNHTFRVRAFGPGGGAATQLVYHFKVERAKPKPKPKPKKKTKSKLPAT
ncbi:MAG TPA: hypothetical protein VJL81_03705 [Solirubrobacterales bacterium]|nr:hypothetical protein [Solirubrobacterales bacterium]